MPKRLLFIHNSETSFVKIDLKIVSNWFDVQNLCLNKLKLFKPLFIANSVKRSDIVFIWFSSWFSFLPILFAKLYAKPVVLVTGGYDTANVPMADYGNQRHFLKRFITNWNIKHASKLILNSQYIYKELSELLPSEIHKAHVVHHGIEPILPSISKDKKIVLNIGNVSHENLHRKGLLPFVKIAKYLPEFEFVQIGAWRDNAIHQLQSIATENVKFLGRVSDEELIKNMQSASVYLQLSLHEAFGMSVIESMQYGASPVVSNHGALAEVVNQHGIVVKDFMPLTLVNAIQNADSASYQDRLDLQKFVNTNYSIQQRKDAFQKILAQWI